jgi:FKBP-type peptidyl-prolyl cis-trans isomerase FkpA
MQVRGLIALLAALPLGCAGMGSATGGRREASDLPAAGPGVLYALGARLGTQVKDYRLDEEEAREIARGMLDSALDRPYAGVLDDETSNLVGEFHEKRMKELARREEIEGTSLLEAALREPGAVKTESGIVLQVIERGSGPSPTIFDYVTVRSHGTLRDGTVFDSSRDKPAVRVQLGATTRCWQEALATVAAGARMHVVCPPALSYGWGGWPGVVPGGAVLSYDLELLSIERQAPPSNSNG